MATLAHVASQTLGIARISHVPKPIDLVALAEAALRIHQRAIESKKVHLVKDLPKGIVVPVYTGEMLQVLSNLIVNALDALPTDGTLILRLRKRRGEVQFVIADNGHGIPAEHRNEIFEPFFTTKKDRGNGLGLALSKKIIERHRGRISIRSSVRPGKSGTTFKISLPA
jgi:signal transduction histidine kinase